MVAGPGTVRRWPENRELRWRLWFKSGRRAFPKDEETRLVVVLDEDVRLSG